MIVLPTWISEWEQVQYVVSEHFTEAFSFNILQVSRYNTKCPYYVDKKHNCGDIMFQSM